MFTLLYIPTLECMCIIKTRHGHLQYSLYEVWLFFIWIQITDKAAARITEWLKTNYEEQCLSAFSQSRDSFHKKEQLKGKKPKTCRVDYSVSAKSLTVFSFMHFFFPFLFEVDGEVFFF